MDDRLFLPRNTVLDGGYRIARVVGSGGFGVTYEADDVNLGMHVAVKEYYPVDFADRATDMSVGPKSERHAQAFAWGRSSFLDEARMLARFEHPGIVRVVRVFEANSTAYMVMRFEHGLSFGRWLEGLHGPPAQARLDRLVAPILDALEVVHGAGVLHRDIAPDNIIIRPDGSPVLLDFGAARRAVTPSSLAVTGIVKAGYSPPEQYASDSRLQGPWSDIYALGATLYRAVTGRQPEEAALRTVDDRMPPAAQCASGDYRSSFLAAIDACLKVDPKERPQSVAELRRMLGAPGRMRRAVAWAAALSGPPRWLIGAAASALVVASVYGGWEYRHARANASAGAVDVEAAEAIARAKAEEEKQAQARADAQAKQREEEEKRAAEERARQDAEAKRQAEAVARREADKAAGRPFDGEWEVVGQGGELCRFKDWKYNIVIENNQIRVPKLAPGRVTPSGEFQYRFVAVGLPGAPPGVFTGKLSGDAGKGRYNYSNICFGSMTLSRL